VGVGVTALWGVRLGVDVGSVRVGIAVSDPDGSTALPLVTLPRATSQDEIVALVAERSVVEVVVGLPRSLSGAAGPAAVAVTAYADELAARLDVPVRMTDERLTTAAASRSLSRAGRSTRRQRAVIDQAAAVLILQGWLDRSRRPATKPRPNEDR
jgi:putative Holliday junction resolvase